MTSIPQTALNAAPFFSAVPRAVIPLLASGQLKPRDAALLIVLLDYKKRGSALVSVSRDELKRKLNCSLDTLQRAANSLKAAGLINWDRPRVAWQRLGKCIYDLSAVFNLMPRRAAKLRHGEFGEADTPIPKAMPQKRGIKSLDHCSVKADSGAAGKDTQAELSPEAAAVVVDLASQGVEKKAAEKLARKHGVDQCRAALALAKRSKNKIQSGGWFVKAIQNGWGNVSRHAPEAVYAPLSDAQAVALNLSHREHITKARQKYGHAAVLSEMTRRFERKQAQGKDMTSMIAVMAWYQAGGQGA